MAKTYIDILKYMIEAKFTIAGSVEKPDIIGAVFGQTEGLLGGDLDLRELQKNGKIGRIEIEAQSQGNRTMGRLLLPSSLNRVETCILGAAIESVDRVGPFETNFHVEKIEDTRSSKRKMIVLRAKELIKGMLTTEIPDSKELSDLVESDVKTSTVINYGPEALPAGPELEGSPEVVLVEGRADVVNLLKNDIPNCIAVGGAAGSVPKSIIDLCSAKDAVLFVDGDRGGDMITRTIVNNCDIDYVARAPDGKEVEELTRKEIIKALRSRIPIEQVMQSLGRQEQRQQQRDARDARNFQQNRGQQRPGFQERRPMATEQRQFQQERPAVQSQQHAPMQQRGPYTASPPSEIVRNLSQKQERAREEPISTDNTFGIKDLSGEVRQPGGIEGIPSIERERAPQSAARQGRQPNSDYVTALNELHNSLRGRLYGPDGSMVKEIPIRELIQNIQDMGGVSSVVFDGIITQRLIDLAYKQGVKEIYGLRANQITRTYDDMTLYTMERGVI